MCAASYSARASRACAGRYQEASTIEMPGASRRSSSQSAETTKRLFSLMPAPYNSNDPGIQKTEINRRLQEGLAQRQRSGRRERTKAQAESTVLTALLLDLADVNLTDFPSPRHMRTTARLAVDHGILPDAGEPDLPGAGGRTHILRLHEPRVCLQFLLAYQPDKDRVIGAHEFHQLFGHRFLCEGCIRKIEIDARIVLAYGCAGDGKR